MIQRTACLIARGNDPCRNLAMEKHLMDTLPDSTAILFLYQNRQSVVVGRNQNPWQECRVDEFLAQGGEITRRLSGGGVSYQDEGTLCFSIILPKKDFDAARQVQLLYQVAAVCGMPTDPGMGVMLRSQGRIYCQNTFYKAGSGAIHHGVIHVGTNQEALMKALGMWEESQERTSPIINLQERNPQVTIESVQHMLYRGFSDFYHSEPTWLDEQMMDQGSIQQYTNRFRDEKWIYPPKTDFDFTVSERFPWGSVSVQLKREGGVIRESRIFSDAMEAALFFPIEEGLVGCPFLIGAITTRFQQKLELVSDPRLLQIAGDVCTLICGRIRAQDRAGQTEA